MEVEAYSAFCKMGIGFVLGAVSLTTHLFLLPGSIVVGARADEPMARVQDFLGTRHLLLSHFLISFARSGSLL